LSESIQKVGAAMYGSPQGEEKVKEEADKQAEEAVEGEIVDEEK
jgi:hypothetical protein